MKLGHWICRYAWRASAGHAGARLSVRQRVARARQPLQSACNQFVFAIWRSQRQLMHRFGRAHKPPPARVCLHRVGTLACVLTGAGAIDDSTAGAVIEDFRASLAARSLFDPGELLGDPHGAMWPVQSSPAGPLLVVPVGVAVDGDIEGEPARFYLSTMILDQRQASIAFTARFPPRARCQRPRRGTCWALVLEWAGQDRTTTLTASS